MMVSNCPRCQIVLFAFMVSNCPTCHYGVKLSEVSNCPRCQIVLGVLGVFSNFHLAIFVGGAISKRSHGLDDLLRSLNDKEQFLKSLNNKERFLKSAAAAANCQQQEDVVALDQSCVMSYILRLSSQNSA